MQKVSVQAILAGDASRCRLYPATPEARPVISPTTLGVVVREGMVGSLRPPAKKQRRRPDKKGPKGARDASSSQPPLEPRVVDRIPVEGVQRFHVAGQLDPTYESARAHTEQCSKESP